MLSAACSACRHPDRPLGAPQPHPLPQTKHAGAVMQGFPLQPSAACTASTIATHQVQRCISLQCILARGAVAILQQGLPDAKGRRRAQRVHAVQVQKVHVCVLVQHARHVAPVWGGWGAPPCLQGSRARVNRVIADITRWGRMPWFQRTATRPAMQRSARLASVPLTSCPAAVPCPPPRCCPPPAAAHSECTPPGAGCGAGSQRIACAPPRQHLETERGAGRAWRGLRQRLAGGCAPGGRRGTAPVRQQQSATGAGRRRALHRPPPTLARHLLLRHPSQRLLHPLAHCLLLQLPVGRRAGHGAGNSGCCPAPKHS